MKQKTKNILKVSWKAIRYLFYTFAFFCLFLFVFSFTTGPFWIYHWLGTGNSEYNFEPDYVVVLGGDGMPSESGLMRTYYAAKLANYYPGIEMIICLPGDTTDTNSSICQMKNEIAERGIDPFRIHLLADATNTRSQALDLIKEYPYLKDHNIVLITSPEHMYRALMTFRKSRFPAYRRHPCL